MLCCFWVSWAYSVFLWFVFARGILTGYVVSVWKEIGFLFVQRFDDRVCSIMAVMKLLTEFVMVKSFESLLSIFNIKSVVLLCHLLQLFVSSYPFHLTGNKVRVCFGLGVILNHWLLIADLHCCLLLRCTTLTRSHSEGRWDQLLRFDTVRDQFLIACQLQSCLSKHVVVRLNPSLIHKSIALSCSTLLFHTAWFW